MKRRIALAFAFALAFALCAPDLAVAAPPTKAEKAAKAKKRQKAKQAKAAKAKRARAARARRARAARARAAARRAKLRKARARKATPPPPADPNPEIEMEPDPAPAALAPDPTPPPASDLDAPLTDVSTSTSVSASASSSGSETTVEKSAEPANESPYKHLYLRAGVARIQPLSQSRELVLSDIDGPASLAVQNGPVAGSGSSVSPATIPAILIGYRLTDRWSLETVAGLPFKVKFKATGSLRDMSLAPTALGIPTGVPALGEDLGEAQAAPPLLTLVRKLLPGAVQPYAGAGVGVLIAYNAKVTNPILTEVSQPDMKVAPAPGLVLQTGIEARLMKRVYARLDVKFIAFMLARARVEHVQVRAPDLPLFDTVEVGTAEMSVWVNPLIVQLGVGTDF